MSSIEDVESLLGTELLTQAGWLLLRATQSLEADKRCAVVELVPARFHVKSGLGILAQTYFARLKRDAGDGMTQGPNSFLFASSDRDVGVAASKDRLTFVLVASASSPAGADLAAASACEHIERLLREATKLMDKIALASTEAMDLSRLPPAWRIRPKSVRSESDGDSDNDSDDGFADDRPLPPMTRKERDQQLDAMAKRQGTDPTEFRAAFNAELRARREAWRAGVPFRGDGSDS